MEKLPSVTDLGEINPKVQLTVTVAPLEWLLLDEQVNRICNDNGKTEPCEMVTALNGRHSELEWTMFS